VGSGDLSSFFTGEISPKREIENKILKKWSENKIMNRQKCAKKQ
jgi:hypothetical protein